MCMRDRPTLVKQTAWRWTDPRRASSSSLLATTRAPPTPPPPDQARRISATNCTYSSNTCTTRVVLLECTRVAPPRSGGGCCFGAVDRPRWGTPFVGSVRQAVPLGALCSAPLPAHTWVPAGGAPEQTAFHHALFVRDVWWMGYVCGCQCTIQFESVYSSRGRSAALPAHTWVPAGGLPNRLFMMPF